ncbi:(Na+)-NQR maturation NqrM [Psychromonas sp. PT13]|uniref:(Na+)-NQR maturation NqrM n=1 Tax=Psychromonas sp. PT13 TaxID=3439547 RepID=UPI003EB6FC94
MEFIIAFVIFLLVVVAMAIGVIMGGKRIQGSCGGLSSVGIEKSCDCETVCDEHKPTLYQIQEPTK